MPGNILVSQTVLLNLSDHYTRTKYQNLNEKNALVGNRIIGCLVGYQEGVNLKVVASFETILDEKNKN